MYIKLNKVLYIDMCNIRYGTNRKLKIKKTYQNLSFLKYYVLIFPGLLYFFVLQFIQSCMYHTKKMFIFEVI